MNEVIESLTASIFETIETNVTNETVNSRSVDSVNSRSTSSFKDGNTDGDQRVFICSLPPDGRFFGFRSPTSSFPGGLALRLLEDRLRHSQRAKRRESLSSSRSAVAAALRPKRNDAVGRLECRGGRRSPHHSLHAHLRRLQVW